MINFQYRPWNSYISNNKIPTSEEILHQFAPGDIQPSPLLAKVNKDIIIAILKKQFGNKAEINNIKLLESARFNTVYYCELRTPEIKLYIKFSPPTKRPLLHYEKRRLHNEKIAHENLQSNLSIPLPKILKIDASHSLINRDFCIVEAVSGIPLNVAYAQLSIEEENNLMCKLGKILAKINSISSNVWGSFINDNAHNSWKQFYITRLFEVINDLIKYDVLNNIEASSFCNFIRKKSSILDDEHNSSFLHQDFWPGNIILKKHYGEWEVAAIIDFECAFWGSHEYELAIIESEQNFTKPFYDAYLAQYPVSHLYNDRKFFYQLHWFFEYLFHLKTGRKNGGSWKKQKEELMILLMSLT